MAVESVIQCFTLSKTLAVSTSVTENMSEGIMSFLGL